MLGELAPRIDEARGGGSGRTGMDTARDILTATATGMIAFTGFVVAGVLVVVQFAAGQYSPRLVLWFRRDRLVKHAIGLVPRRVRLALVALRELERRDEQYSPDVTVGLALVLLVGSSCCSSRCCSASRTGCGRARCTPPSRARGLATTPSIRGLRRDSGVHAAERR